MTRMHLSLFLFSAPPLSCCAQVALGEERVKAVAYRRSGAIDRPESLVDTELPNPGATGHDLLVQVRAVAVNHIDCTVRFSARPDSSHWKVLGWDVAGTVAAVGP